MNNENKLQFTNPRLKSIYNAFSESDLNGKIYLESLLEELDELIPLLGSIYYNISSEIKVWKREGRDKWDEEMILKTLIRCNEALTAIQKVTI